MLRNPANEQVIGAGTGRPKADVYYYAPAGKKLVSETSADYKRVPALKMCRASVPTCLVQLGISVILSLTTLYDRLLLGGFCE